MLTPQHTFLHKGPWDLIGRPEAGCRTPRQKSHVSLSLSTHLSLPEVRPVQVRGTVLVTCGPCLPQENETVGYLHRTWLRKDSQRSPSTGPHA